MAARAGDHYWSVFQSHHRVTQGYPLSHTIFNVVVYAVIRHWVTVLPTTLQESAGQEGLGTSIKALPALFYVDDELVALLESARLQGAFDVLTDLFDRVGLWNNDVKTVRM